MDNTSNVNSALRLSVLKRAIACLGLIGLVSIAAMQPALASDTPTGHLVISAQVVYHCKIQTHVSVRQQAVRVVMRHCSGQPRINTAAFSSIHSKPLPGTLSSEYTLNKVVGHPHSGVQYLELDF